MPVQFDLPPLLLLGPLLAAVIVYAALGWPVLGCLVVHALGQISYPGPRRARRQAILAVRRIRDFVARRLTWTTAVFFLGAAACVAWTATLPGFAPLPAVPVGEEPYAYQRAGVDGRIPGPDVAASLAGAVLGAAATVIAVIPVRMTPPTPAHPGPRPYKANAA